MRVLALLILYVPRVVSRLARNLFLSDTSKGSPLLLARAAAPPREGLDCPEDHEAEPEIQHNTQIKPHWHMAGHRRQMGHEQEIHHIPRHHGDQRLDEVLYSWF